jgi:primary-amine oxidase
MSRQHPLDPLSAEEVRSAVSLLQALPEYTPKTRVISIMLKEPPKQSVYAWPEGPAIPREAIAILFDNGSNRASRVDLDLTSGKVNQVVLAPEGTQPTLSIDEQEECERAVLASDEFRAALERHYGVSDTSLVMVDIWSAGNYGSEEDRSRRLARPLCFLRKAAGENGYVHPIEGIRPVVDLNTMEVIRVEEHGVWPLPEASADYAADRVTKFRTDLKPLVISQPEGPSFALEGNQISWQKWRIVIGFNAREALTIHDLRYLDGDRYRPILYRASMTEMVVPYGDPRPTQVRKNAFDVGEYGMGMCTNSLRLGCDCVGHIHYLDAHLCTSRGEPLTIENAICIHEEDFGILWKHTDRRIPDKPEVRRSRRLVISCVATVENYEYGFFWYFYQDGNIQFEIKLTGILSLSATRDAERPAHGALLNRSLFAPNHQHFFNVRLDMTVDGVANTVQQIDVVADALDENNSFANAFHAVAIPLQTEKEACANLNLETGRTWKIVNPAVKNIVGEPVGYRFFGGDNAVPFGAPTAWWRKRAGFVEHHVWVTPFNEEERYAAGDYPNQSDGTDGLLQWIERDRPIENTDLVFWYTFGHTHIPRLEDYPVMPTAYIGFLLKPSGFFDLNPANDVPPSAPVKTSCCK